jgi:hypothetical protein
MNKLIFIIALFLLLGNFSLAQASQLRPLNVQNAKMDTENKNELRINFDWMHSSTGKPEEINIYDVSVPRINYKRTFNTIIPTRVGISTGLSATGINLDSSGEELSGSAFGFQNMGLSLEAGVVQKEDLSIAIYINQNFPFTHNPLISIGNLIPVYGISAYGL